MPGIASPGVTLVAQRDQAPTVQNGGTQTNPTANTAIASVTIPFAGNWEITSYAFFSGTIAAGDLNNMGVFQGSTNRFTLPLPAVAQTSQPVLPIPTVIACAAGDVIAIKAVANASGASAVYNAAVTARNVS